MSSGAAGAAPTFELLVTWVISLIVDPRRRRVCGSCGKRASVFHGFHRPFLPAPLRRDRQRSRCTILPCALATVLCAVQGGCPSEPALQSLHRALTIRKDRRARRATQSPGPGEGLLCLSRRQTGSETLASPQAAGRCATTACRNGSYGWPLTSRRCSRTANFRATATTARFLPFLPPVWASRSPRRRRSESTP